MQNNASGDGGAFLRRRDYLKITVLGFALTALWQSLHTIVLPLRLLDFVPEAQKNTSLGLLTLTGLLLAMVVQPLAGAHSDRSQYRWGRRRPYVLLGGLAALPFIAGIGLASSYAAIFIVYCLLQAGTNIAQGPYQAFIPEMVPASRHGLASGVKGLMEILGGAVMVYIAGQMMDRYTAGAGSHWLWLLLGILAVIMLGITLATVIAVREPAATVPYHTSLLATLRQTAGEIRLNRAFLWFLASRLLVYMAFTTIQQFALYYLRDVIGVTDPAGATARFTILAVAVMLLIVWPAGYLSDRIGRRTSCIAAGLCGALGIAVIFFSGDYSTILWAAGIIGIGMGVFNSTNWALATDLVAKGEEARYLAVANMATAGGAALARLAGIGIDFFNGYSEGLGYRFMLLLCFLYFLAGAVLVSRIKGHR